MINWIDVKTWRPEPFESVLICCAFVDGEYVDYRMAVGFYTEENKWWKDASDPKTEDIEELHNVTHWTLLPTPPKIRKG